MTHTWDAAVMSVLGDVLVRPTLVAIAVGLVLFTARVRDGALRNAAWRVVLVVTLAAPFLPQVLLPIPMTVSDPPPVLSWLDEPPAPDAVWGQPVSQQPIASEATQPVGPSTPLRLPTRRAGNPLDWRMVVLAGYGLGVLLLGARLWAGWRGSRRVLQASRPVDPRATRAGGVPLRESPSVTTPVTLGLLRPAVVLPSGWRTWPAATLGAVLAHEGAHATRHDPLVAFAAQLNRTVFWFHPVAWWIERRLATTAEQACDDAVVDAGVERRRYAEVLVQMVATVRARGGRLRLLGVGAHGTDIETRIERLLDGRVRRASRSVRVLVAAVCLTSALVGVSCQQQARELKPDPEVAARIAEQAEATARYETTRVLSDDEVQALEARVAADPEDLDARETLLTYYRFGPRQWSETHTRFRFHALWLIEHHPESPLVAKHQMWAGSDPTGEAEARRLWLAHVNRPDASPAVLSNAAYYFQATDEALAADLLLRGQALDPGGPPAPDSPLVSRLNWSARLGWVYARAIADRGADGTIVESPFGPEARRRLADTRDATTLMTAASWLMSGARRPEDLSLAARCAARAQELTPDDVRARTLVTTIRTRERNRSEEWARTPTETLHEQLSTLSDADRLRVLPDLAERDYMGAENKAWTKQAPEEVARLYARSKGCAEELLDLLPRFTGDPDYGTLLYRARITRALHAQRDGDRRGAVRLLLDAAEVPPTETLAYTYWPAALEGRLVNWLLKDGEHDAVATFLERTATFMAADGERRRTDAAAIRRGVMPSSFQHAMDREAAEAAKAGSTVRQ